MHEISTVVDDCWRAERIWMTGRSVRSTIGRSATSAPVRPDAEHLFIDRVGSDAVGERDVEGDARQPELRRERLPDLIDRGGNGD